MLVNCTITVTVKLNKMRHFELIFIYNTEKHHFFIAPLRFTNTFHNKSWFFIEFYKGFSTKKGSAVVTN